MHVDFYQHKVGCAAEALDAQRSRSGRADAEGGISAELAPEICLDGTTEDINKGLGS